ncbi:DNA-directed RNA polymerase subunit delta [Mesomycoplasma conjunctivae]|uniref:DNA-directed RNA polymerase subunit delta n=1 Tax=Mesomycoplasma conjunctivae TaxID=45361 RepID=UPI003DA554CE
MDTIISVAKEFLSNKSEATFEEIFKQVQIRLMSKWEKELKGKYKNAEQILIYKRGELYKLLTIDGNFIPLGDNVWTLRSDLV